MDIVTTKEKIPENLQTLENYMCEGTEEERAFAISLIKFWLADKVNYLSFNV